MYRILIRPFLFLFYPETAHNITLTLLGIGRRLFLLPVLNLLYRSPKDPSLEIEWAGIKLKNPVGLAAGFDKDGKLFGLLKGFGFSHIEVGTVTAHEQPGNDKPRVFRLPQAGALINRMGFNNPGSSKMAGIISAYQRPRPIVLGINIGKSKVTELEAAHEDYARSAERLAGYTDYVCINVSSPNTPGLRQLQNVKSLGLIVDSVRRFSGPKPVVLKIAPDLAWEDVKEIADFCLGANLAALAISNTTLSRDGVSELPYGEETGGLSGKPLLGKSTQLLGRVYEYTQGRLPLIGLGGISSGEDVWQKIIHGASFVQIYTGYIYEGPGLPRKINRYLVQKLKKEGLTTVTEAVGLKYQTR